MSILLRGCLTKLGATQCVPTLLGPTMTPMPNSFATYHVQQHRYFASVRSSSHDEASLIRQRIPKAMAAHTLFIKENFAETKQRSDSDKTAVIFCEVLENFKNLSPSDQDKYAKKAEATRKAHSKAMSALTQDEKEVLLVDFRKRMLRRKIFGSNKELMKLKDQLNYPGGSGSSYSYFWKDKHELVADEKTVPDRSRALGRMWNSTDQETRLHYILLARKHALEAKQRQNAWRQNLERQSSSSKAQLARFDELRSEIRRAKLKLDKLERCESVDEAAKVSAPKKKATKKKLAAAPKKKRVVKKKVKAATTASRRVSKLGAKKGKTTAVRKVVKKTTAKKPTSKK